jgi:hypothetical protein
LRADASYEREVCCFSVVWTLTGVEGDDERGEACCLCAAQDRERHVVSAWPIHAVSTREHRGCRRRALTSIAGTICAPLPLALVTASIERVLAVDIINGIVLPRRHLLYTHGIERHQRGKLDAKESSLGRRNRSWPGLRWLLLDGWITEGLDERSASTSTVIKVCVTV